MSIVRAARKAQFYNLPTNIVDDDRLSWEARGMLVYLLSKPDMWTVQVRDLINRTKKAIGKSAGKDKVYSIINELRAAGYVYREFKREGGNFVGVDYEVSETPDLEAAAEYVQSLGSKTSSPFPDLTETVETPAPFPDLAETAESFTAKPETLDSTERATKIEKAVKPITDPQDDKTDQDRAAVIDSTLPADYPSDYPSNPTSAIYAAWLAYAVAFRERYKIWPVYNATVAGIMGKAVARIQDATPAAATHYVKHESAASLTDKLHPVAIFLKNCESYAGKAVLTEKSQKRADRAAVAVREAEQASASAPLPAETIKSTPSPASTGAVALSALKTRVGIPSK
ncbi:hypothetical protein [Pseudomonas sp. UMAB-40]|uniref:hypothetical protein n=1 Tax=Pseudomonas sp. UMAB-40 TaxID=1365407 RepID=UPI001C5716C4|nr:hypothetical protein [Pseudomonas sp. UMAB-40]